MRLSLTKKVGLVSLFSCLTLLLGLLSSTAMASVHTATTLQSAHISSMTLADDRRRGNFEHEGIIDPPAIAPRAVALRVRSVRSLLIREKLPNSAAPTPFNDSSTTSGGTIYYHHDAPSPLA